MAGKLTISTLNDSSGVLATQNGMTGIAKAWLNYNGTTQTITASFNVSSVTYTATGNYTVNFTTAMSDANYCVISIPRKDNASIDQPCVVIPLSTDTKTTTSYQTRCYATGAAFNSTEINVCVFR